MSNRERIIDSALSLFNARGTGAVSTNHIADAAGISPGNLYYHFNNKEAILRALFERLFTAWDETLQLPTSVTPSLADLDDLIAAVQRGNKKITHFDCSCFDGEYIAKDVNADYLKHLDDVRSDNAKQTRKQTNLAGIDLHSSQ